MVPGNLCRDEQVVPFVAFDGLSDQFLCHVDFGGVDEVYAELQTLFQGSNLLVLSCLMVKKHGRGDVRWVKECSHAYVRDFEPRPTKLVIFHNNQLLRYRLL
jgi:hypothetical protein